MSIVSRIRTFFVKFSRRRSAIRLQPGTMKSPTDRLPNELLSYIFLLIAHDPTEAHLFPSTLSHVSSQWREVALATGGLWTRIVMSFPITAQQISCCKTYLSRSGVYPLDILLDLRDPAWDWEEESHKFRWQDMEPLLRIFLDHVGRWKRIQILTDTWAPIFTFLWYTRQIDSAPMLQTISLSRCNAYFASRGQTFQPTALRQPIQLFAGALESLRTVSLVGVHVNWAQSSLRNLSSLELKYHASDVMPTLDQFRDILASCPGLLRLSIIGWGPILDDQTRDKNRGISIRVPLLQQFSFGFLDTEYAIHFLSLLEFPSLVELCLEDVSKTINPLEQLNSTPVLEWFARTNESSLSSSSSLNPFPLEHIRSVEFHGVHSNENIFAHFFQKLPTLKRLGCYDISDDALRALLPQNAQPPHRSGQALCLCPSLTELYFQDVNPEAVIDLVASRAYVGSATPFHKVTLEFVRIPKPLPGSAVQMRLANTGIDVIGSSQESLVSSE